MRAVVSPCGRYRYAYGTGAAPFCAFVLLNPSPACVEVPDDATTLRLRSFTKRWGVRGLRVVQLGRRPRDGSERLASAYETLVVGWGANAPREAVLQALPFLTLGRTRSLRRLGRNKNGSPKHPLYLSSATPLVPWKGLM